MKTLSFDQLPGEVARQGAILDQIQTLLTDLIAQPKESDEEFLNIDEAASFLNLTKNTLYVKVSKREVPHIKKGKYLFFSKADLTQFINDGKRKTNEEIRQDALDYCKNKGGHS